MVRYIDGATRTFWGLAFRINAWAVLYTAWPVAFAVFLALGADGRFRPFPVPVYNCTVVNDVAADDIASGNDAVNGTTGWAAAEAAATMLVRRPNDTADAVFPDYISATTERASFGWTLHLRDCSLHSVLPIGDLFTNSTDGSASMIAFVGPTPGQQVPVLGIIVVGLLYLASVLA
jgi:hypothetical protein